MNTNLTELFAKLQTGKFWISALTVLSLLIYTYSPLTVVAANEWSSFVEDQERQTEITEQSPESLPVGPSEKNESSDQSQSAFETTETTGGSISESAVSTEVQGNSVNYTSISTNVEYKSVDENFSVKFSKLPQSPENVTLSIVRTGIVPSDIRDDALAPAYKVTTTPELVDGSFTAEINYYNLNLPQDVDIQAKYSEDDINYNNISNTNRSTTNVSFSVDHFTTFVLTPVDETNDGSAALGLVDVTPATSGDWAYYTYPGEYSGPNPGSVEFVTTRSTTGSGSWELNSGDTGTKAIVVRENFTPITLSDISEFSYDSYIESRTGTVGLYLNVYLDDPDVDYGWYDYRIDFEPIYNGAVEDSWQNWDLTDTTNTWYVYNRNTGSYTSSSYADILTNYGDNEMFRLAWNAGDTSTSAYSFFRGYLDNIIINDGSVDNEEYDLERAIDEEIEINIISPSVDGEYFRNVFEISAEYVNDYPFSGLYTDLIDPSLPAGSRTVERCRENGTIASPQTLPCTIDSNNPTNLNGTNLESKLYRAKFTGFQSGAYGNGSQNLTLFRDLYIDNIRPEISNTSLTANSTLSRTVSFSMDTTDPALVDGNLGSGINTSRVRGAFFEPNGSGGFTRVGSWTNFTNTSGNTWAGSIDTRTITDGVYQFRFQSQDMVRNFRTVSVNNITIDNTAPTVTITNPIDGDRTNEDNLVAEVTASDAVGIGSSYIRLWQDAAYISNGGTLLQQCFSAPGGTALGTNIFDTCEFDISELPDGTYFISAQYLDSGINWGSDVVSFEIDNTGPPTPEMIDIVETDSGNTLLTCGNEPSPEFATTAYTNQRTITINWVNSEDSDVAGYYYGNRNTDRLLTFDASTSEFTGDISPGADRYYYSIIAFDDLGNESEIVHCGEIIYDVTAPQLVSRELIVNGTPSTTVTAGDNVQVRLVVTEDNGISTTQDGRYWMANVVNNWAAGTAAQRISTDTFTCTETSADTYECLSPTFTMPPVYQNGDAITLGLEEQYFNGRVFDNAGNQMFFPRLNFTYEVNLDTPTLLGYNHEEDEESFATPRPNTELSCGDTTFVNGVSAHWTEVTSPSGFGGYNLMYQRQFQRLESETLAENEFYTNPYTNYREFDGNPGNAGTYDSQVRAFIDINDNGQLDISEPRSDWSNNCEITFEPDTVAPIVSSLIPDLNSPVAGDTEILFDISDINRGDNSISAAYITLTDSEENTIDTQALMPSGTTAETLESFIYSLPGLADGNYTISICGEDIAGNLGDGADSNIPTGQSDENECFEDSFSVQNSEFSIRLDDRIIREANLETYIATSNQADYIGDAYEVVWSVRYSNSTSFSNISDRTGERGLTMNTANFANVFQNYNLFAQDSNYFVDDPINPIWRVDLVRTADNAVVASDFAQVSIANVNPIVELIVSNGENTVSSRADNPTINVAAGEQLNFSGNFTDPAGNFDAGPGWDVRINFGGTGFLTQPFSQTSNRSYSVGPVNNTYANGTYNATLRICEEGNFYGFCGSTNVTIVVTGGTSSSTDSTGNTLPSGSIGTRTAPDDGLVLGIGASSFELIVNDSVQVVPGETTTFSVNAVGVEISECRWDFGDNTDQQTTDGTTIDYNYAEAGTYELTVNCEDAEGNVAEASSEITAAAVEVNNSDVLAEEDNQSNDTDEKGSEQTEENTDNNNTLMWIIGGALLMLIVFGAIGLVLRNRNSQTTYI